MPLSAHAMVRGFGRTVSMQSSPDYYYDLDWTVAQTRGFYDQQNLHDAKSYSETIVLQRGCLEISSKGAKFKSTQESHGPATIAHH